MQDSHQEPDKGYLSPSGNLQALTDAWATDSMMPSPHGKWAVILRRKVSQSIEEVTAPEIRLAGMRIDPFTRGPSREHGFSVMLLLNLDSLEETSIQGLPGNFQICPSPHWSPDGSCLAFTLTSGRGPETLWFLNPEEGAARCTGISMIRCLSRVAFSWLPDSSGLIATTAPHDIDGDDLLLEWAFAPPTAPAILECGGEPSPVRTYQDLLRGPSDRDLFIRACSSLITRVAVDGTIRHLAPAGLYYHVEPSPDGRYILVNSLEQPFSYMVPWQRFPFKCRILNSSGETVADLGTDQGSENLPQGFDAVRKGPRLQGWRDDADAVLTWVEALDNGDPSQEADDRDSYFMLSEPFNPSEATLVATLQSRFQSAQWTEDGQCLISALWRKTHRSSVILATPDQDRAWTTRELFDYCYDDRYNAPGTFASWLDCRGRRIAASSSAAASMAGFSGKALLLVGEGACPEGDRPYIDAMHLETGQRKRIWRCGPGVYQKPLRLLEKEELRFLLRCESREEYPNHWELTLSKGARPGGRIGYSLRPLTARDSEVEWLASTSRLLMKYRRDDGVNLSGNLHLPPGKSLSDGPFPTLIWAYPREFNDPALAGQVKDSPYRFPSVSPLSPLAFLGIGFAVLERPIMPIVGRDGEEPNDSYIEQLVLSARAAVEELVRLGISSPGSIAVGGHSYGAFMAANLLVHTDIFACGIARSGAYNRTLTPFGFQAEPRTFWQASETYLAMSPFLHADKLIKPLLIIHGESDDNPGTQPLQSRLLFGAMKACGGIARMVMLPGEGHGYTAVQSQMHMLREMEDWLNLHCLGKDNVAT